MTPQPTIEEWASLTPEERADIFAVEQVLFDTALNVSKPGERVFDTVERLLPFIADAVKQRCEQMGEDDDE